MARAVLHADSSEYRYSLATSFGHSKFAHSRVTEVVNAQAPYSVCVAHFNGKITAITSDYSFSSGKETSVMGMVRYSDSDLSDFEQYIDTTSTGGPIMPAMQSDYLANMCLTQAFGRSELKFTTVKPGVPGTAVAAYRICLGGWSSKQIGEQVSIHASKSSANPHSLVYYSAAFGHPTQNSTLGTGSQWASTGTAGTVSDGYLEFSATSPATSYSLVSTTDNLWHRGFSAGLTIRPTSTEARMDFSVDESAGSAADGLILNVLLSTSGIEVKSFNSSLALVSHWTSSALDSAKTYQVALGYNGTGGLRVIYRSLSDAGEYTAWIDSGTISINQITPPGGSEIFTIKASTNPGGTTKVYEWWATASSSKVPSGGNVTDMNIYAQNELGAEASSSPIYLKNGVSMRFAGHAAATGDTYQATTRSVFPKENILVSSPRLAWRSSSDSLENTIVLSDGASLSRAVCHDGAAAFGTNFRQMMVEYDSTDAFSSPTNKTLYSDVTGTMTVASVSNNSITLQAGSGMTRGEHKGKWLQVLSGADQWSTYRIDNHPDADKIQINTGAHSISAADTCVVFGNNFSQLYAVAIEAKHWRIRIPVQSTFDGYFQIGTVVAGPAFKPGNVPLDWTIADADQHNIGTHESDSGIVWGFRKGPTKRTVTARFIGDANRQRDSFRAMVRGLCDYQVRPMAFIMDGANEADTSMLGVIAEGLSLDSEGWYKDEQSRYRLAGDLGITIVEVV